MARTLGKRAIKVGSIISPCIQLRGMNSLEIDRDDLIPLTRHDYKKVLPVIYAANIMISQ